MEIRIGIRRGLALGVAIYLLLPPPRPGRPAALCLDRLSDHLRRDLGLPAADPRDRVRVWPERRP